MKKIIKSVNKQFQQIFNEKPLLVFSPGRINLIGEHTDYNEGYTFPAAINKGIALGIVKSENNECTAVALDKNESYSFQLSEVAPLKKGGWRNYVLGVVGEIKKLGIEVGNFNLAFSGNIPGGAGMSSSAALENSVAFALNELFQLGLSKNQMILVSQKAEHNYAKVNCGIMDQYASIFGEKDSALLMDCRSITSESFKIDFKDYKLLLINTNVKHDLSETAYNDRRAVCERVSSMLKVDALRDANEQGLKKIKNRLREEDFQKAMYVIQENKRVIAFATAVENEDIKTIGALLYQSHEGLSEQYQVSCAELDFLVNFAKKSQTVIGARMMGGGFGGCTINLVHQDGLKQFKKEVSQAFKKEFNNDCSIYKVKLSKGTYLVE